ncbi:MAG: hypothetical protein R3F23_04780 [Verrucomicrobiia bacterium]
MNFAAGADQDFQGRQRPVGLMGWLLMAPMLLWLFAFVVAPALILLVYSFCERDTLGQVVYQFNWSNYKRVFDPIYVKILLRSLWYAFLTTVLCVGIGYPVA